ncbi:endonuclease NucS [Salinarchaeum chitinilyticum]
MPTTTELLGDGGDAIRVLSGDCTVVADGDRREERRGHVTVVLKPDNTVLVHDADGYQPVAWLTRADAVSCSRADDARGRATARTIVGSRIAGDAPEAGEDDGAAFTVDARDGDERLRVVAHTEDGYASYPATRAGHPVGECPDCDGTLVRSGRAVNCIGCGDRYGLPDGATVREERCSCGLPRLRVERGAPLDVCLDRSCDPLADAVEERFDREWACPDCGEDLRVIHRGALLLGCDAFPDCEVSFGIPTGTVVDTCGCGLPIFELASGRRCLDSACDRQG